MIPTIPELRDAVYANPADEAARLALIDRLERGKLTEEANEQRIFLEYVRAGGSGPLAVTAEWLLETLRDRAPYIASAIPGNPPAIRFDGIRPADLLSAGGEIILRQSDRVTRFAGPAPIAEFAECICPLAWVENTHPTLSPDSEEWPLEPPIAKLARAMAQKQCPGDEDAEAEAIAAARRAAEHFQGFGHLGKLAATYVRYALMTYKRTKARRLARERKIRAEEREHVRRHQTARGTHNGRPILHADDTSDDLADPTSDDLAERIEAALALLPPDLREAVKRHHIDKETVEAIARSLDVSVRTVQRRLKEGREILTEKIRKKGLLGCRFGYGAATSNTEGE